MCSWCWAYRPTSDRLAAALPATVILKKIVGGLAPDSDEPMPQQMRDGISDTWKRIHAALGTDFNFDFWSVCEPRRSTYPACRAVIAATGQDREDEMINAIQHAYYLRAMNPSDRLTLEKLAHEIGLDVQRFARDLRSDQTEQALQRQLALTRHSLVRGFPTLMLKLNGHMIPLDRDYTSHTATLLQIGQLIGA